MSEITVTVEISEISVSGDESIEVVVIADRSPKHPTMRGAIKAATELAAARAIAAADVVR